MWIVVTDWDNYAIAIKEFAIEKEAENYYRELLEYAPETVYLAEVASHKRGGEVIACTKNT